MRETESLEDGRPVGDAVHRLLSWEEHAILDLIETWGWVDRSHRKLAHRGQLHRRGVRLALDAFACGAQAPGRAAGRAGPPQAKGARVSYSHFTTHCKRVAYAIVDVVTKYWIGYLLTSEQTHTQVQLLFAQALEDQGLLGAGGLPLDHDGDGPILVAWSDNGAEMTAIDTRQFMALMAITQHHGRPGTPTDQAHIESFFSHLKGDWPHLNGITDPAALDTELPRIRTEYNTCPAARRDRLRHPR